MQAKELMKGTNGQGRHCHLELITLVTLLQWNTTPDKLVGTLIFPNCFQQKQI